MISLIPRQALLPHGRSRIAHERFPCFRVDGADVAAKAGGGEEREGRRDGRGSLSGR